MKLWPRDSVWGRVRGSGEPPWGGGPPGRGVAVPFSGRWRRLWGRRCLWLTAGPGDVRLDGTQGASAASVAE